MKAVPQNPSFMSASEGPRERTWRLTSFYTRAVEKATLCGSGPQARSSSVSNTGNSAGVDTIGRHLLNLKISIAFGQKTRCTYWDSSCK